MTTKCDRCLYRRLILSENGFHYVCALSDNAAKLCITGMVDRFIIWG